MLYRVITENNSILGANLKNSTEVKKGFELYFEFGKFWFGNEDVYYFNEKYNIKKLYNDINYFGVGTNLFNKVFSKNLKLRLSFLFLENRRIFIQKLDKSKFVESKIKNHYKVNLQLIYELKLGCIITNFGLGLSLWHFDNCVENYPDYDCVGYGHDLTDIGDNIIAHFQDIYLLGLNYQINNDITIGVKYSYTTFVSSSYYSLLIKYKI